MRGSRNRMKSANARFGDSSRSRDRDLVQIQPKIQAREDEEVLYITVFSRYTSSSIISFFIMPELVGLFILFLDLVYLFCAMSLRPGGRVFPVT
jgi:hypothetical protein